MTDLTAALIWKNGFAEGLSVSENKTITQWPSAWGEKPTQKEIDALKKEYSAHLSLLTQIESLEGQITPRRFREAIVSLDGKQWLEKIELQIKALRDKI